MLQPERKTGKTEAWVVLQAGAESRIYAGLKPGTTADNLRRALTNGTVADDLKWFTPGSICLRIDKSRQTLSRE
jgi:mannose-6-phosphate isomerase